MAVKTSNKADESTVKDFKYWTGLIPYNVVAVNPNLEELKKIGIDYLTKEPEYYSEKDFGQGPVKSVIVDFWLKSAQLPDVPEGVEVLTNVRFNINVDPFEGSNTGKKQFINAYGRTTWVADASELDKNQYYKNVKSRQSHRGEEELHKFLFAWLNMSYDDKAEQWDECQIDIQKLMNQDFSELKTIVAGAKNYVVKCLTGINIVDKEGKIRYYYTIYNKMFLKHNQHSTNRMQEYIGENQYNEFKADAYTFDIQEFDKSAKPDNDGSPDNGEVANETVF